MPGAIGRAGGFVFFNFMQYLALGFSLDLFIKSCYVNNNGDEDKDSMKQYTLQFRERRVDMYRDAILLPGLPNIFCRNQFGLMRCFS